MLYKETYFYCKPKELEDSIRKIFRSELELFMERAMPKPPDLISRIDTAKLLGVSLVTLNKYTKTSILQSYKVGAKVFYKLSEIQGALNESTIQKYRRIEK